MIRNKNIHWFIGKIGEVLQKHPEIKSLNELACEVLRNQNNSLENEFYCDVALIMVQKQITLKKKIGKTETLKSISLAA